MHACRSTRTGLQVCGLDMDSMMYVTKLTRHDRCVRPLPQKAQGATSSRPIELLAVSPPAPPYGRSANGVDRWVPDQSRCARSIYRFDRQPRSSTLAVCICSSATAPVCAPCCCWIRGSLVLVLITSRVAWARAGRAGDLPGGGSIPARGWGGGGPS